MIKLGKETVDLTVTSPPYDNLRDYKGYSFDFEKVAKGLYWVTKIGGIVVWVVGDATIKGSETGTSFKQALYFKEIGFNLHDTMVYHKKAVGACGSPLCYNQAFEYMFIFTKGKIKTFNPIKDLVPERAGKPTKYTKDSKSNKDGYSLETVTKIAPNASKRQNLWTYEIGYGSGDDKTGHPAVFPESLVNDHILSWSNENDLILDPFMGSGTTAKMAKLNNRNYIGFEISQEYCDIAEKRLENI
jgi:site-specific DNA-methyltransferase (adenine-specific)